MASNKRIQFPGIIVESGENPDAESAELDEMPEIPPEQFEEALLAMDRMLLLLPPGVSMANGITIDREAVHAQLQVYLRLHEDVRRTQQQYDDALVRLALSHGKWGLA